MTKGIVIFVVAFCVAIVCNIIKNIHDENNRRR